MIIVARPLLVVAGAPRLIASEPANDVGGWLAGWQTAAAATRLVGRRLGGVGLGVHGASLPGALVELFFRLARLAWAERARKQTRPQQQHQHRQQQPALFVPSCDLWPHRPPAPTLARFLVFGHLLVCSLNRTGSPRLESVRGWPRDSYEHARARN